MKAAALVLTLCFCASPGRAQTPPPVLDVHLHAEPLGEWSGAAICAPFEEWAAWDPGRQSYEAFFSELYLRGRACDEPLWAPTTDEELLRQTIAVMERRNVYGVLGGAPGEVAAWRAAAPGRFIPAIAFSAGADDALAPDSLRRLVRTGRVQVLGEV